MGIMKDPIKKIPWNPASRVLGILKTNFRNHAVVVKLMKKKRLQLGP